MIKDRKKPGVPLNSRAGTGPRGLSAADFADWYREETFARWRELNVRAVAAVARELENAAKRNRNVFVIGNGGSAAAASHMAVDLSKTAAAPGKPLLRCTALTDNMAFITAVGNDLGYDKIFVRQMENLLNRGDLVLIISGSGNSPNIVEAAKFARKKGARVIGLVGFAGGRLKKLSDICVHVRSDQYGVIEDVHMGVGHILTFYLKQRK